MTALTLAPGRVARILAGCIALLVAAELARLAAIFAFGHDSLFGLLGLVDMDAERTIPTWYSSVTLLAAAALLAAIAAAHRRADAPWVGHWRGLAAGFLVMSIDEMVGLHERLNAPLGRVLGTAGVFHFGWVAAGLGVVALAGLAYLRFLLALPRRSARAFVASGIVYLSGAVVMEMIDGRYAALHPGATLAYGLLSTVEETLEMAGVALFIWALLDYARRHLPGLALGLGDVPGPALEVTLAPVPPARPTHPPRERTP